VVDHTRSVSGDSAARGFLFSDVRGFTAFAERHGNAAAAAMVGRFLEIARKAIASHEGAEIKTEGDAIHAVFPSAAGAVLCGLEIVDAAAELNAREPDRPLGLGVGVHAGEAVETAEGYIGTAVNVAARLCAAAQPGEVLVSSTVKRSTQASIPVGFIARGRKRLKGIREPVEAFAVTRDMTARTAVVLPRLGMLLGTSGLTGVALVIVVAIGAALPGPPAIPTPTPGPAAQRVVIGPLPIGTYRSVTFEPRVTFDIIDPGWAATGDTPNILGLVRDTTPNGTVSFVHVREVIQSPCGAEGESPLTNLGAADLITQLKTLPHVTLTEEQTVRIGGYTGTQVDVAVADGALAACGGLAGGDVTLFGLGGEVWGAASGERFRLVALVVGDQSVTILEAIDWTATPSVQELLNLYEVGGRVLDSVRL
jgi:class 3 adenylate cyclase